MEGKWDRNWQKWPIISERWRPLVPQLSTLTLFTLCLKPEPSLLWLVSYPALLWLVNRLEMSRPLAYHVQSVWALANRKAEVLRSDVTMFRNIMFRHKCGNASNLHLSSLTCNQIWKAKCVIAMHHFSFFFFLSDLIVVLGSLYVKGNMAQKMGTPKWFHHFIIKPLLECVGSNGCFFPR